MPSIARILAVLVLVSSTALASPIVSSRGNALMCPLDDTMKFTCTVQDACRMMKDFSQPKELRMFMEDCCNKSNALAAVPSAELNGQRKQTDSLEPLGKDEKEKVSLLSSFKLDNADGRRQGSVKTTNIKASSKNNANADADIEGSTNSQGGSVAAKIEGSNAQSPEENAETEVDAQRTDSNTDSNIQDVNAGATEGSNSQEKVEGSSAETPEDAKVDVDSSAQRTGSGNGNAEAEAKFNPSTQRNGGSTITTKKNASILPSTSSNFNIGMDVITDSSAELLGTEKSVSDDANRLQVGEGNSGKAEADVKDKGTLATTSNGAANRLGEGNSGKAEANVEDNGTLASISNGAANRQGGPEDALKKVEECSCKA